MKKISAKQQQILDYISSYSLEHGYPPSVREIGAEMGLRSPSTVHAHLKKLQEAGYLEPNEHKSRALTPVSGPSMVPRVPILGRVTAGMPILAVEEHIGYVPFEPAAGGGEYYALRIRGDSMIGVGIMDDDLVIIRQDIQARNGDIVIAHGRFSFLQVINLLNCRLRSERNSPARRGAQEGRHLRFPPSDFLPFPLEGTVVMGELRL